MATSKAITIVPSLCSRIFTSTFPQNTSFCFAYGSGVFKQAGSNSLSGNMIDMIFTVDNPLKWHKENILVNPSHYSALHWLGHGFVARFQENWGARVYFNTLIPIEKEDVFIKYGVVSTSALVTDLLDWNDLYLAGRLHKPVEIIQDTTNSELRSALQHNLHSAVHAALLILPEYFSENDFYHTIAGLSYVGDFRMIFGEDKNKVFNIVKPQIDAFKKLYYPIIKALHCYVDIPFSDDGSRSCSQDLNPIARLHHLNKLPKAPQRAIVRYWNKGSRSLRRDTEDTLRAVAYDSDCGKILELCIADIVWASSIRQSIKSILTAGLMKSVRYSVKKIAKMFKAK